MEFEDILYEKNRGIARITINRPKVYNAFRSKTIAELTTAFEDAEDDRSVGVIVFTGAGNKAFCSGGDVAEMGGLDPHTGQQFIREIMKLMLTIRGTGKPVIARVNGYCLGGGNELNVACDLTIASENSKFGQVGPTVGSVPIVGGTQMLPRVVGEKKAREMIFLCQQYSAHEAAAMGLVNKVVPQDQLEEEVDRWCQRILELSPQALRIAKTALNFESDMLYPSLTHGRQMLCQIYGGEEFKEGMKAFLEKRRADFEKFRK
jgi:dihydroxynaphthoic acid synthetase